MHVNLAAISALQNVIEVVHLLHTRIRLLMTVEGRVQGGEFGPHGS